MKYFEWCKKKLPIIFSGGKTIALYNSVVMLIVLLFSDQISKEGGKSLQGDKLPQLGHPCPPLWKKARSPGEDYIHPP